MDKSSSLLLDIDGLVVVVDQVVRDDAGRQVVYCSTDPQLASWCRACGEQSTSPKAWVTTRPRDVRLGQDRPILLWRKRKWRCRVISCERKVLTECLPEQIPARARVTTRARRKAAQAITPDRRSHPIGVRGLRSNHEKSHAKADLAPK